MSSEHRLHPASILFRLAGQVREFAVPLLLALFAGSRGGNAEVWASVVLVPYALFAVGRYLSYRYRFEPHELVVRNVFIFRNERHIPYDRIQNLDAIRNVVHRALGVVDVRIETGSGAGEDAHLSVITWEAYEEMRRRVFAGREAERAAAAGEATEARSTPSRDVLLALPGRELVLLGLIENRGAIVFAGAFGLLWESGLAEGLMERFLSEDAAAGGLIREILGSLRGTGALPWDRMAQAAALLVAFLVLLRLLSIVLVVVRLRGFRLSRAGEDLRTEYGLLTRVSATIPLRRVQTVTIADGPLLRWARRASIRVDTAGGASQQPGARGRESLAPIVSRDRVADLVAAVLPDVDLAAAGWQPPAPGAAGRVIRRRLASVMAAGALLAYPLQWHAVWITAALALAAVVSARRYVAHLGWARQEDVVLFRSGWLWRHLTIARLTRIQSVALHESPFDRRRAMARVRVDTAGASATSHRIDIPYVARDRAGQLYADLAASAARTAFHW
jgi:putative membrane protein